VQVVVAPRVQVQPEPDAAVAVSPAGRGSLTVIGPLVGAPPEELFTTTEYVPVCPALKFPECDLVMERLGAADGATETVSEADLLEDPPPLTLAVSVIVLGGLAAMLTVRVMGG
jgi:hypothetical protein